MIHCNQCGDKGLIRICYREDQGQSFDIAVCTCQAGMFWRRPDVVRAWAAKLGMTLGQVGRIEEFEV